MVGDSSCVVVVTGREIARERWLARCMVVVTSILRCVQGPGGPVFAAVACGEMGAGGESDGGLCVLDRNVDEVGVGASHDGDVHVLCVVRDL